jgi:alkylation response protein AidB-like acyl-CoA dehydrogenase
MSEPGSGSDLASLQTRATEDGDDFVINGQKIWTSVAMHMNYIYLVALTDPKAPKGRGISEFVIRTDLPGITIRPLIDLTGIEAWGECFFDNVRISKKYLIGEKNRGFYQILNQLDYERAGVERLMGNYPLFEALIGFVKETRRGGKMLSKDIFIRQKLAQLRIEFEVGRLLIIRVALVIDSGRSPTWEAAVAKAYGSTFEQHLATVATDILGLYGQLIEGSKYAQILGMAPHSFLASKGFSLQAGTTEVLKNIVALRRLNLPDK